MKEQGFIFCCGNSDQIRYQSVFEYFEL